MAEVRDYLGTPADMAGLDRFGNDVGFLAGFAAVAALLVFHAAWRTHVEPVLLGRTPIAQPAHDHQSSELPWSLLRFGSACRLAWLIMV
jgi:hypothetical protein